MLLGICQGLVPTFLSVCYALHTEIIEAIPKQGFLHVVECL